MKRHPEEIECFRMPPPNGKFSPDKRYEYTYATRKSWEYIPSLRRQDWRYFTNKAFIYVGKWLRSEQRGFGDGGDYWEVFQSDDGRTEKTVSWDYDGTLCYRECPYNDIEITTNVTKLMDEMIEEVAGVGRVGENEKERIHKTPCVLPPKLEIVDDKPWSLVKYICGEPSKCGVFDPAETSTMESKYSVHANIAEFWCFLTSFFYGSSLLLYFVKEEEWFEKWREAARWPDFIHFSIAISVLVMICSATYHCTLFEVSGCIDCFLASFVVASVTMSTFGIDMITQVGVLLGLGTLNMFMWRYSTRLALIVVGFVYPFVTLSCMRMKGYYGAVVFSLISLGVVCFLLDRMGYAPLHSVWHILGGLAITGSLYHVIVNGPL
jgi:hypothetical protein